ncbi:MAG: endonuclease/exonuclease/phosphatase family protein [Rikenellaceae bacterium]|nr:endonuclease/exonuclease/phosphatase family protein [Rikenellaceae bacterium]
MKPKSLLALLFLNIISANGFVTMAQDYKVMTYNVHHCNPPAQKGIIATDSIASVIHKSGADIVLLQEVDYKSSRVQGIDQPLELSQKSGLAYYRFFKAIDIPGGEYGVMILSRYPITSSSSYLLPSIDKGEQRVIGIVEVKPSGQKKICVACTHLDLPKGIREIQAAFIDSLLGKRERLIFGGDFNATPESPEIKFLRERYISTSEKFQHTFPNTNPDVCIDYIFTGKTKSVKILYTNILKDIPHSDHLPVLAEISL